MPGIPVSTSFCVCDSVRGMWKEAVPAAVTVVYVLIGRIPVLPTFSFAMSHHEFPFKLDILTSICCLCTGCCIVVLAILRM